MGRGLYIPWIEARLSDVCLGTATAETAAAKVMMNRKACMVASSLMLMVESVCPRLVNVKVGT